MLVSQFSPVLHPVASSLPASALANLVSSVPIAIAIGGLIVAGFALGPAMVNSKVPNLGTTLRQMEQTAAAREAR